MPLVRIIMHPYIRSPTALWLALSIICLLIVAQSPGVASRHLLRPTTAFNGVGTLDFRLLHRDAPTFWITLNTGLPSLSVSYSPLYYFILLQQFTVSCLPIPAKLSMKQNSTTQKECLGFAFRRIVIILMLFISGNIHPNPGPDTAIHAVPTAIHAVPNLTFSDFCDRTCMGFLHINIRSLLPKLDLLNSWVHTVTPDVLAISESWLKKSIANPDIFIPGYNIFRQDRATKGGGVALYVKDHLQCVVSLSKSVPKLFELLVIKIKLSNNFSLSVAVCYRPPSAPLGSLTTLSELLAPHISSEFILLGDLNWDMNNPPDLVTQQFDALNLYQIISEPTRVNLKCPSSATLIDVILTNAPSNYKSGVFSQDLSDHCAIACTRSGPSVKRPPVIISKRCLKNFNLEAFLHDTAAVDWNKINTFPTWSFFKLTFSQIINKHAPLKKTRIKDRFSPWFSRDLAVLIRQKNSLWRKARSSQSPANWLAFRQCRNKCTQAVRKAKVSHFLDKFASCGSDAKKFWKTVKSMENKLNSPHLPSAMTFGDTVVTDKSHMASLFNQHFVNSAHVLSAKPSTADPLLSPTFTSSGTFSFRPITTSEVLENLTKLDCNKSAGSDGLDPMFLKAAAPVIAVPISRIFNLSLEMSFFPLDWKSALVFPLFKGGSSSDPNCYRPISILPCLAKVLEKLVHEQLSHFLTSNNILSNLQSGFRPGRGCTTATLRVLDDIISSLDSKQTCIAAFIDLSKAFDSVIHSILLQRLSSIGLSPHSCNWFASYLNHRVQQVKSENIRSAPLTITKGVPQGSILGPTLFSIYINDITRTAGKSKIHLYADDTILYSVGPSLHSAATTLQQSLTSVEQHFHSLHLLLNTNKTKCVIFDRKRAPTSVPKILCADGSELEFAPCYKYLGLWLDSSLSFATHIKHLQSKVKARLSFLYRNKASFTRAAKHTLVKMTILPIFDYGDSIYRMASHSTLRKLDPLHHSAIRFATGAPFTTHHCDLYNLVDWTSLSTRRLHHWFPLIYKTILGITPHYLSSLLHISHPARNLRSSTFINLTIPTVRTVFGRSAFRFAAAFNWNTLQNTLKLSVFTSLSVFKQNMLEITVDSCTC